MDTIMIFLAMQIRNFHRQVIPDRNIDNGAREHLTTIGEIELLLDANTFQTQFRTRGIDIHRTTRGIAAGEHALRTFQHFDAFQVTRRIVQTDQLRTEHAIHVKRQRIRCTNEQSIGGDATESREESF